MIEENKKQKPEKQVEGKIEKEVAEAEKEIAKDVAKIEEKVEGKKGEKETKLREDASKKQEGVLDKSKKTEAVVNGKDLPISTKYSVAICNFIRGKEIDNAIFILEDVEKKKRAVPMKGELPHRKGKIMSGKYPVKATNEFIKLLKSLRANAIVNELELEKYRLFCKADVASRPYRRFGRTRFKRSHVQLKLVQPIKKKKSDRKTGGGNK